MTGDAYDGVRLRLHFGPQAVLGPGRVELLELIEETGSIAGAGRRMKMSYKRAWSLVEEMNSSFAEPLVEMSRGGSGHGGAFLTPAGHEVAARYRAMLDATLKAIEPDLAALRRMARLPS